MNQEFVRAHFFELLADALFDDSRIANRETKPCSGCGRDSTHAKCDQCFRAYRVERNRVGRQRQRDKRAA